MKKEKRVYKKWSSKKNKRYLYMLAAILLQSNLSAKECISDVSNHISKEKYINQQDKILNNPKEIYQSNGSNFIWKVMHVGGKVIKWTLAGIGVISTIEISDNYHNAEAKKEYLSLVDKYKSLSYNERLDKFIETIKNLIVKYEENDKNKRKDTEKEVSNDPEYDERTIDYLADLRLLGKSKDDMNNVSFGRLKDGKRIVCADFTHILQTLAQELGLICYHLMMQSTKGKVGHSVLMIAQKRKNSDGEKKFNWFIIDGVNYLFMRDLCVKKKKEYPKIRIANMIKIYKKLDAFDYDKMYIAKNSNCIFIRDLDAKNEMVAILNDKLLDQLDKGYDVNWTDDSYVKCFEQIEKDKL